MAARRLCTDLEGSESQELLTLRDTVDSPGNAEAIDDCIELLLSQLAQRRRTNPKDKVTLPNLLNKPLLKKVKANPPTVLVVGPAGVGKSSLINTLALRYLCKVEVRHRAAHGTHGLQSSLVNVQLDGESYDLILWDSQGFSGDSTRDDEVFERIEKEIPNPDVVIICFDITTHGGRINELVHHKTLRRLHAVNGGKLFDQCVIALTKANMMALNSESRARFQKEHEQPGVPLADDDWHGEFKQEVEEWMSIWPETLKKCGVLQGQIDRIPVCIFGQMMFSRNAPHLPIRITPIGPWGETWLQDSWGKILHVGKGDLAAMLLVLNNKFQTNLEIPQALRDAAPDISQTAPSAGFLKHLGRDLGMLGVALCIGAVAVGVGFAPFTAGVSVGASLGAVAVILGGAAFGKTVKDVNDASKKREECLQQEVSSRRVREEQQRQQETERRQFREAFYREYTLNEADAFIEGLRRARTA